MELLGAFTSSKGSYTVAGDRGADHCIRETPLVVEWSDQSPAADTAFPANISHPHSLPSDIDLIFFIQMNQREERENICALLS